MAKDNKCKACGNDISYADCFCPKCGYEQHIYPEEMSDVVRNQVDNYERLRLEIWNSHKHSPIAHLLMLGNVVNNVYDIFPGNNTFGGSAIEGELNHQIIIKPDVSLKPLHFSIEAIDGKFNFVDHVGDLCLSSSSLKNQVHIQKEGLDLVFIKKM